MVLTSLLLWMCTTLLYLLLGNDDVNIGIDNITFPAFLMSGDTLCFEVLILDDDILEGKEYVEIGITSDDVSIDDGTLEIWIEDDNDLDGTVEYSAVTLHIVYMCWDAQLTVMQ